MDGWMLLLGGCLLVAEFALPLFGLRTLGLGAELWRRFEPPSDTHVATWRRRLLEELGLPVRPGKSAVSIGMVGACEVRALQALDGTSLNLVITGLASEAGLVARSTEPPAVVLDDAEFDRVYGGVGAAFTLASWLVPSVRETLLKRPHWRLQMTRGRATLSIPYDDVEARRPGVARAYLDALRALGDVVRDPTHAALDALASETVPQRQQVLAVGLMGDVTLTEAQQARVLRLLQRRPSPAVIALAGHLGLGDALLRVVVDADAPTDLRVAALRALNDLDAPVPAQLHEVLGSLLARGGLEPLSVWIAAVEVVGHRRIEPLAQWLNELCLDDDADRPSRAATAYLRDEAGGLVVFQALRACSVSLDGRQLLALLSGKTVEAAAPLLDAIGRAGQPGWMADLMRDDRLSPAFRAQMLAQWSASGVPAEGLIVSVCAAATLAGAAVAPTALVALTVAKRLDDPRITDVVSEWATDAARRDARLPWMTTPALLDALVPTVQAHADRLDALVVAKVCRFAESREALALLAHLAQNGTVAAATQVAPLTRDRRVHVAQAAERAIAAIEERHGAVGRGALSMVESVGGELSVAKALGGELSAVPADDVGPEA